MRLLRLVVVALNHEECRASTTSQDAAFIPPKGFVLEAINPANMRGEMDIIAQKKTQQKPGRDAHNLVSQRRGHCLRSRCQGRQ